MFSKRVLIGFGTYALDMPDQIVDLNSMNRDEGWQVRIRSAYFLSGEWYLKSANQGLFIGEQVGFQNFKVSNDREVGGSTDFNNILLLTYVGYSWHPYKGSFYVKPWVGLGFTDKIDGINKVGTMTYNISNLYPSVAVHLGYSF